MDVGMEFDIGEGPFDDLLGISVDEEESSAAGQYLSDGEGSVGSETSSTDGSTGGRRRLSSVSSEAESEAEAGLRYSKVLGGEKQKYPLDWQTIKSLHASMDHSEQQRLGMQVGGWDDGRVRW